MFKTNRLFGLFFVCALSLFYFSSYAQSHIVEFDFQDSSKFGNAILPFDEPFSINFIGIPDEINSIVVRIYVLGSTDGKKIYESVKNNSGENKELTNQDILQYSKKKKVNFVYKPDSLFRNKSFIGSSASMKIILPLQANSEYLFEILTYEIKPISEEEQGELYNKIINDDNINQVISDLTQYYITDIDANHDNLDAFADRIIKQQESIIKKDNESYTIKGFDFADQLGYYAGFTDNLSNIFYSDIPPIENAVKNDNELLRLADKDNKIAEIDKKIDILESTLLNTDWMTITSNSVDPQYKKIYQAIDSLRKSVDSLSTLKTRIEPSLLNILAAVDDIILNRDVNYNQLKEDIADIIVQNIRKQEKISKTYPKSFSDFSRQFITSDIGLAYVGGIDRAHPYVAANIYLRPINDSIPLRKYKGFWNVLAARTSFIIGLSVDNVNKDSVRQGLILDGRAVVTGVGFRIIPWLKVNAGSFLYYKKEPNPLLSSDRLRFTGSPFISISIDLRLQTLLGSIGPSVFRN